MWLCAFTAGYLFVDTCFLLFFIGLKEPIDRQMLAHHVLGFANYYLSFWQLGFPVTIGAALIFMEISTPFVVLRWLFFRHGQKGSLLQNINTVFLFVTFIFGRVVVQFYLLYFYGIDWLYKMFFEKVDVPTLYKVFLFEMFLAVSVNVVLNFYWSFLILRQLWRVLTRGPNADKNFTGDEEEKGPSDLEETSKGKRKKLEMNAMIRDGQTKSD